VLKIIAVIQRGIEQIPVASSLCIDDRSLDNLEETFEETFEYRLSTH
jgi:hypothetical protein